MKTNKILKSSLSKTSSLKKSSNYKFETENLQQIVKQKWENCLQVIFGTIQIQVEERKWDGYWFFDVQKLFITNF